MDEMVELLMTLSHLFNNKRQGGNYTRNIALAGGVLYYPLAQRHFITA
jgi:hypothetical protein